MYFLRRLLTFIAGVLLSAGGLAASGPLGIDHRLNYDDSGIWDRKVQLATLNALMIADVAGALWEGSDSRLGKTFWYSIDSTLIGSVSVETLKRVFGRERPRNTSNPNEWADGASFPSGEVTAMTAIVTPFILEYRHDHPAVYALELLPLYDGIARMKVWGHWQTDVLAGFAIGTTVSIIMHSQDTPLFVSWLPDGIGVGVKKRF